MENILWNTWQYLVDVFDCFLILYLFRKMMRTRLRQPKYYYLFLPVLAAVLFASILNGQGDKPTMELILEKMRALKAEQTQTQTFSEADIEYLNTLITLTAERMEKLS